MLGHIACLLCWKGEQTICPTCPTCNKLIVGQNIALEAVLESIRLPCRNANLGCCKSVSYSQRQMHNNRCEFTQSVCPIPGCTYEAFSGAWQAHFVKDHKNHDYDYTDDDYSLPNYGESCTIRFDDEDFEEDRYYTFLGPGKDVLLLVKEIIPNVGNALSLYYIDLPDMGRNYLKCKLRVKGGPYRTSSLQSKSRVVSIKEWKKGRVHDSSLLLPSRFLLSRYMKVNVLVNKKKW
ncbi:E3 ubiquitin-protein ligase SINA-like 6 [Carex littledalei]|uniref:E3 ubiquitin-protein ligase SINA-like 6 n=1 Tax=Carex littledalei TaxID=544730 RepID=A0A833W3E2_9POAL|nr:E3 ubiquitin-protein ligase SINA-like 6 [Carex littledalei]